MWRDDPKLFRIMPFRGFGLRVEFFLRCSRASGYQSETVRLPESFGYAKNNSRVRAGETTPLFLSLQVFPLVSVFEAMRGSAVGKLSQLSMNELVKPVDV